MINNLSFYKKISHYLSPYKGKITIICFFSIITAGLNLLPIQVIGTFVDIIDRTPQKNTSFFWIKIIGNNPISYIATYALIYIVASLFSQWYNYQVNALGYKVCQNLRSDAFKWALNNSKNGSVNLKDGDIVARIVGDTDSVRHAIIAPLNGLLVNILELVWALLLLYTWSPLISLVTFSIVPVLYLLNRWSYTNIKRLSRERQNSLGYLTDVVSDVLRNKKANYSYSSEISRFEGYNQKATQTHLFLTRFFSQYWPAVRAINATGVALSIWASYILYLGGKMAPEDIMITFMYCQRVYGPIMDFTRYNTLISTADAALGRVLELEPIKKQ